MNHASQRTLITRWVELDKALETVVEALRRDPTVDGMLGVRDDPARLRITAMMDALLTALDKTQGPRYYVLYMLDDGGGDPSVMQAVQCAAHIEQCDKYNEARLALDSTECGVGLLPTPDGANEYNIVTTVVINA